MINLNIKLSKEKIDHINNSKNRRTKNRRVKDITGIGVLDLPQYIDNLDNVDDSLLRCGFCGSIRAFNYFEYVIVNEYLYIDNIKYSKNINICSRNDTIKTKECKSKKLNPNSKEFVKIAYGFKTLEEANEYILERNASPFYKTNYDCLEEYKKAQTRGIDFFKDETKFQEYKNKIGHSNKKETMIEKYGKVKADYICRKKDSSSKKYFEEKYKEDWEKFYYEKLKKTSQGLDNFIIRYGDEIGKKKYYEYTRELPFGMTLDEHKENDEYKLNLAKSNGFDYYVVFDTDDFDKKSTELSKIIYEKYKER